MNNLEHYRDKIMNIASEYGSADDAIAEIDRRFIRKGYRTLEKVMAWGYREFRISLTPFESEVLNYAIKYGYDGIRRNDAGTIEFTCDSSGSRFPFVFSDMFGFIENGDEMEIGMLLEMDSSESDSRMGICHD